MEMLRGGICYEMDRRWGADGDAKKVYDIRLRAHELHARWRIWRTASSEGASALVT